MSLTEQDLQAIKTIVDTGIDDAITSRIKPMIDEAVEDLRLHTAAGFAGVDQRFAQVDQRLDGIDSRLDGIDERLDVIDERLDGIDGRLDSVDGRLIKVEGGLIKVEHELTAVKDTVTRIDGEVHVYSKTFERLEKQQRTHDAHFEEHDTRLVRLEKHTGLSPA